MKYNCLRCGIEFKQKNHLICHLNRKNICEPIDDFISIDEVKKHYGFDTFDEKKLNGPQLSSKTPHFSSKILKNSSFFLKNPQTDLFENPQKSEEIEKIFLKNPQKSEENEVLICKYCSKNCSRSDNLKRHLQTCKKKKEFDGNEIIQEQQRQILEMKEEHNKEILELKETMKSLLTISDTNTTTCNSNISNSNNTTNNITNKSKNQTNNNDNSTNINVTINNYGNENKDYITKDYLIKLLKEPFQAIPRLIEYTHFNKDHPENQNIKLPNKKQPYVKVLKDDKWIYADRKSTILDLIDEKHCELNDSPLIKHIEEKFSEHLQDRFERFNDRYLNEEKDFTTQLYKETELVMINNR